MNSSPLQLDSVSEDKCNVACTGDSSSRCGGDTVYSVYSSTGKTN